MKVQRLIKKSAAWLAFLIAPEIAVGPEIDREDAVSMPIAVCIFVIELMAIALGILGLVSLFT